MSDARAPYEEREIVAREIGHAVTEALMGGLALPFTVSGPIGPIASEFTITPDPFAALKDRVIRAAVARKAKEMLTWEEYVVIRREEDAAVDALLAAGWKEGM